MHRIALSSNTFLLPIHLFCSCNTRITKRTYAIGVKCATLLPYDRISNPLLKLWMMFTINYQDWHSRNVNWMYCARNIRVFQINRRPFEFVKRRMQALTNIRLNSLWPNRRCCVSWWTGLGLVWGRHCPFSWRKPTGMTLLFIHSLVLV